MPLTIQTANGFHVASLNGPLDQVSGTDMVTTIRSSVGKGTPLILDFTAVPHMDGGGFRQLLALKRWADQGNSRLILAGMNAESWALVVENNCTNTFESKPSLAAALQAAGAPGETGETAGEALPPPVPRDDFASFDTGFEGVPEADSALFSGQPPTAAAASGTWTAPSASAAVADTWEQTEDKESWEKFSRGSLGDEGNAENERKSSRKALHVLLAVAAVVVIGFGIFWLLDYVKEPSIRLDETAMEAQVGKEMPTLSIWVKNGVLSVEELDLPPGIDIVEGEEINDEKEYLLSGSPRKAGKHEIIFIATRENNPGRKSPPASVELVVTEVKLEWQQDDQGRLPLNSAGLIEKKPFPQNSISKIVTGAKNLSMDWQGTPLAGVRLIQMPNTETSWQLAGTPETPGTFRAQFVATKLSGETESRTYELLVSALPPPPPPPVPSNNNSGNQDAGTKSAEITASVADGVKSADTKAKAAQNAPPPSEPDPKADEKMRGFLLERIEKANSHFSDDEKSKLRLVVNTLKEARQLGTVHFKTNSHELSSFEKNKLLDSLKDPAIKKLLDDEDCQILVVGYADKTGKLAHNIKLSKLRAREVDMLLKKEIHRRADLCGDYGPTDVISEDAADNRVVEVYIGTIEISGLLEDVADKFKEDFNKRHGLR